MTAARERIAAFVAQASPTAVADDDDIFELGLVSSLFALELVSFVEATFQITVDNDDLELANFRSIAALAAFVAAKRAREAEAG